MTIQEKRALLGENRFLIPPFSFIEEYKSPKSGKIKTIEQIEAMSDDDFFNFLKQ